MGKLNGKQKRFVDEYLVDLNATQAAIRAGYSAKTAEVIGYENLRKPQIQAVIRKAMEERAKRTEITQDRVLEELAAIGFARGTDYAQITQGGHVVLTPTEELDDRQRAAVLGVKETQYGVEIKLADKVKALELLGKHLGIFEGKTDKQETADTGLLTAIEAGTGEEVDTDDLPEVQ